jgi:cytochrome c biogenesis protein CcmG/thiol:disulfide interchange protein DsbE
MPNAERHTPYAMRSTFGFRRSAHIAAAALCVLTLAAAFPAGAQRPGPGTPAPDFTLDALDSTTVHLAAFRGHPVVINFWATWCPPCIHEMPELATRFVKHREANLEVLAVNADGEKADKIRRFAAGMSLPFPLLLDPKIRTATAYGVIQLPVTVFVDSAGVIRRMHAGPIQPGELDAGLREILGESR